MTFTDLLRDTLATLWSHKRRTLLTMFGIAWGIISITLMVAAGEGLGRGIQKNQETFGKDVMIVFSGRTSMHPPAAPAVAALARQREAERSQQLVAESATLGLEQRVSTLRHEVVRLVSGPGTQLKSAPFHSSVSLQALPANTEVVILIVTPYWLGVETPVGQRGWVRRDQLKELP